MNRTEALDIILLKREWEAKDVSLYEGHECTQCLSYEMAQYIPEVSKRLILNEQCHTCDYWIRQASEPGGIVTPMYTHYRFHNPNEPLTGGAKGFGGAEFLIIGLTGVSPQVMIFTNDLWHQGHIPEHLQEMFRPNFLVVDVYSIEKEVKIGRNVSRRV